MSRIYCKWVHWFTLNAFLMSYHGFLNDKMMLHVYKINMELAISKHAGHVPPLSVSDTFSLSTIQMPTIFDPWQTQRDSRRLIIWSTTLIHIYLLKISSKQNVNVSYYTCVSIYGYMNVIVRILVIIDD